jgi:hypothetical protein
MRRTILLLATMTLTLLVASGVALAVTKIGTDGPDTLRGTNGDDILLGRGGNDTLLSLAGNDDLLGGRGKDWVLGTNERRALGGNKNLVGGPGNDGVEGGLGSDTLLGGSGNDFADGDRGSDNISGADGNDFLSDGGVLGGPASRYHEPYGRGAFAGRGLPRTRWRRGSRTEGGRCRASDSAGRYLPVGGPLRGDRRRDREPRL